MPAKINEMDMYYIGSLKITGPINGTDILFLRKMAGIDENNDRTGGILAELDLSDTKIVAGGLEYYDDYLTEYDVIGKNMFAECYALEKVVLPKNITKIDNRAFRGCESLKYISIPETIEEIGEYAFADCKSLISITLPKGIKRLLGTFQNCSSLTSIELPDSLRYMSYSTFYRCI